MEFRTIIGFSGYEINSDGVIRNKKTGKEVTRKSDNSNQVQINSDLGQRLRLNVEEEIKKAFAKCVPSNEAFKSCDIVINYEKRIMAMEELNKAEKVYLLINLVGNTYMKAGQHFSMNANQISGLYGRFKKNDDSVRVMLAKLPENMRQLL